MSLSFNSPQTTKSLRNMDYCPLSSNHQFMDQCIVNDALPPGVMDIDAKTEDKDIIEEIYDGTYGLSIDRLKQTQEVS
jgi:hypothetical protein